MLECRRLLTRGEGSKISKICRRLKWMVPWGMHKVVQPNILVIFLYRMSMEVEGSLVITNVNEDEDAKYQCLAKNVVGTRGSAKAQLSILGKNNATL